MFVGLLTRASIVRAAYSFLGKSLKIKSVVQRRLEFLKAVRLGRYILNELVGWVSCEGSDNWAAYSFSDKSLKTKSAIQHRLDFLKAARVGRYVFNGIDRWASHEGSHSLGRMLISSEILENQICDPASAGISEGHQIWKVRFRR